MTYRILAARLRRCLAFALALLMAAVLAMQATRPALADDKQKELESKKNQIQQELDALKQEQTFSRVKSVKNRLPSRAALLTTPSVTSMTF